MLCTICSHCTCVSSLVYHVSNHPLVSYICTIKIKWNFYRLSFVFNCTVFQHINAGYDKTYNNVLGMNNSDRFFIGLLIVMQRVYCVNDKSTLHIYYETTVNSTKNQKTPILTGGVQF